MEAARELNAYSAYQGTRRTTKSPVSSGSKKRAASQSGIKALAEGIILQAIEDLGDAGHRKESLQFFMGEGFDTWAGIARLKWIQQVRLARLVSGAPPGSERGAGKQR
jgi:hypothetical protein